MAKKTILQEDYRLGIRRDVARDGMPNNAVWDMWDFIPDRLGSPVEKRGGWVAGSGGGSAIRGMVYAPFTAGHKLLWLNDTTLYILANPSATNLSGSTNTALAGPFYQNPVYHRELVVVPRGGAQMQKYDGSTVAALAATAPTARYAAVYKDRTVAGNISGNESRVQFGPAGNPTGTWDTTNAWVDTSAPVAGIFAMRNALLVYHSGTVERIRGSVPPGTAGFDMVLENLFTDVGCFDARSIVGWQENVIWADVEGVFMTDGAALLDLTAAGGVKDLWRETFTPQGGSYTIGRVASGVFSGLLVVSLQSTGATDIATFVCDLSTRTWYRFTNFPFATYAAAGGSSDELFGGGASGANIAAVSTILHPTTTNRNDGNSTAVLPGIETGYFVQRQGIANWKDLYIGYDLRDASGSSTLAISAAGVEESFTSVGTLPKSTRFAYQRLSPRTIRSGVAVRLVQTAASDQTRLYQMTADAAPLPDDRIV